MNLKQDTYHRMTWDQILETHYGWFNQSKPQEMLEGNLPEDVAFIGFDGRHSIVHEARDLGNNRQRIITATLYINPKIPRLIMRNSKWQDAALEVFKGITDSNRPEYNSELDRFVRLNFPKRADVDNDNSNATNETMMVGVGSMAFVRREGQWLAPMLKRDEGAPSFAGCWAPAGGNCTEALPITFDKKLNEKLALLLVDKNHSRYVLPTLVTPRGVSTQPQDLDDEFMQRLKLRATYWYGPSSSGSHKFNQEWPIVAQPVQLHQFPWASQYEGSIQIKDETTGRLIASTSALGFLNKSGVVGLLKIGRLPPRVMGLDTTELEPGVNCLPLDLERLPNLPQGREVGFLNAEHLHEAAQKSLANDPSNNGNVEGGLIDIATSLCLLLGKGFKQKLMGLNP